MKRRWSLVVLVLLLALAPLAYFALRMPEAPAVQYPHLLGGSSSSHSLRGQVVLVKFWATTCTTCVAQMPDAVQLHEHYHDKGLRILAVAMAYDSPEALRHYAQALPFPVVHDSRREISEAFGKVRFTPVYFLLGRDGQVIKRYLGRYDKAQLRADIEKALGVSIAG